MNDADIEILCQRIRSTAISAQEKSLDEDQIDEMEVALVRFRMWWRETVWNLRADWEELQTDDDAELAWFGHGSL